MRHVIVSLFIVFNQFSSVRYFHSKMGNLNKNELRLEKFKKHQTEAFFIHLKKCIYMLHGDELQHSGTETADTDAWRMRGSWRRLTVSVTPAVATDSFTRGFPSSSSSSSAPQSEEPGPPQGAASRRQQHLVPGGPGGLLAAPHAASLRGPEQVRLAFIWLSHI